MMDRGQIITKIQWLFLKKTITLWFVEVAIITKQTFKFELKKKKKKTGLLLDHHTNKRPWPAGADSTVWEWHARPSIDAWKQHSVHRKEKERYYDSASSGLGV